MDIDPQKCVRCGKAFECPTSAEAVCECSKSVQQQPAPPEKGIVFLQPCPKCGDQKRVSALMIGTPEKCQCGFEFRYALVLAPLRPEPIGWMLTIQRHANVCTQQTLHWWRQSVVPGVKRAATYVREHVIPRIVPLTISAWNWMADSITTPPQSESENRYVRHEPTKTHALEGDAVARNSAGGGDRIVASNPPKDPVLMGMLSGCCIVGLGHMILGQTIKGIVMLLAGMVLAVLTGGLSVIVVWPAGGIDAYLIAKKLKEGKTVGQWDFF